MASHDSTAAVRSPSGSKADATRVESPQARDPGSPCLDANHVAELLEGMLPEQARRDAEKHIDACPSCRELVAGLATRLSLIVGSDQAALSRYARGWVSTMRTGELSGEPTLAPGDIFDHYEIKRLLGRGGMGEVYLARDLKLERDVALKMVRFLQPDSAFSIEHFMTEARMTARLNHPHIVTVHAVGEHDGRPYLALEYVRGKTMRQWMRQRQDRQSQVGIDDEVLGIALSVAEALEEAHRHGILHRDLKPENVLIDERGRVCVVDFGLAMRVEADADDLEQSQPTVFTGVVGTPRYMAPEQWLEAEQGAAVDIWALGVILFELITGGLHPAGATRASDASLVRLAVAASADSVEPLPDDIDVPAALRSLVDRCLLKDPAARPDASETVATLRSLLEAKPERDKPQRGWIAALVGVVVGAVAVWGLSRGADETAAVRPEATTAPASATASVATAGPASNAVPDDNPGGIASDNPGSATASTSASAPASATAVSASPPSLLPVGTGPAPRPTPPPIVGSASAGSASSERPDDPLDSW